MPFYFKLNKKRKQHDITECFRTPKWVWEALAKSFPFLVKGIVCDPSAGHGEAIAAITKAGNRQKHTLCDIRPAELQHWKKNNLLKDMHLHIGDFLKEDLPVKVYDCIISNPPFSLAVPFIEKSLKLVHDDGFVCFLQRLDFLASQKRSLWFSTKKRLKYVIVLSKRPRWLNINDEDFKSSDSKDHCIYVFQPSYFGEPKVKWLIP